MSAPFKWPTQLKTADGNRRHQVNANARYVLVRNKVDPKSGKQKTSSSSDGLIDIAAAVQLGLIPSEGLPGALLCINQKRVSRLLRHNTVVLVKPKIATITGIHATTSTLKLAEKALADVLGPAYWKANKHLGLKTALKTRRVIPWIKVNLENTGSALCTSLIGTNYEDLIGLEHSQRWWLNLFGLRQNVQSNRTDRK